MACTEYGYETIRICAHIFYALLRRYQCGSTMCAVEPIYDSSSSYVSRDTFHYRGDGTLVYVISCEVHA